MPTKVNYRCFELLVSSFELELPSLRWFHRDALDRVVLAAHNQMQILRKAKPLSRRGYVLLRLGKMA